MRRASIGQIMQRIRTSATFAVMVAAAASVLATTLVSAAEARARSTAARWSDDEREMLRSLRSQSRGGRDLRATA